MSPNHAFPRAINFHVLRACNARCRYCFATFRETRDRLSTEEARAVLRAVREAGGEKMNFVGGEPTLHPSIGELIVHAHELGFVTSIVSNGARLDALLASPAGALLDWVGLSVDSASDEGNAKVGRGGDGYVARVVRLARRARSLRAGVKLNTVVTRVNVDEDMSSLLLEIRPQRWKVFQALRVVGQNDGSIEPLLIETEAFQQFVARHRHLEPLGVPVVPEDNASMTDSYAMIDPMGRFYGDTGGRHRIGLSILEHGPRASLESVGFAHDKLVARGGMYEWGGARRALSVLP